MIQPVSLKPNNNLNFKGNFNNLPNPRASYKEAAGGQMQKQMEANYKINNAQGASGDTFTPSA